MESTGIQVATARDDTAKDTRSGWPACGESTQAGWKGCRSTGCTKPLFAASADRQAALRKNATCKKVAKAGRFVAAS